MRILKNMKKMSQNGDTIVEVLICMAIVSFSLGISYGITRRSLAQVRVGEERSQALKIAQQQLERLKQYIIANPSVNYPLATASAGTPRCVLNVSNVLTLQNTGGTTTDPVCDVNNNGSFDLDDGSASSASNYPFRAGYIYDGSTHDFYVYAGIPTATGLVGVNTLGYDFVTLQYRIHP
ncbi:MAG TPA: type II secretion system protein [Candidatus Saccharimonadales bacterium]|nr:type II secretion system protein [Candidatus Saccharimonadales bacterium]